MFRCMIIGYVRPAELAQYRSSGLILGHRGSITSELC